MMLNKLLTTSLCAAIAASSCATAPTPRPAIGGSVVPYDFGVFMIQYEPPMEYERWMQDVERCSGISRDPKHEDTFWLVPRRFLRVNAKRDSATVGEHDFVHHHIRFGIGWEMDSSIVRHELLHHLLTTIKDPRDHDPLYFREKCKREIGG